MKDKWLTLLKKSLNEGRKSCNWLEHSYELCKNINFAKNKLSTKDFDALESLTSRFARLSDIVIQKIFKGIDYVERETPGSVIDLINKAEKRGLCKTAQDLLDMRDLRNSIAHEYSENQLVELFKSVHRYTPKLIEVFEKAEKFCKDRFC